MSKLWFVAFSFLISINAFADCQYSDGTKLVRVKEGEAVSLRDPGKSLENMTMQDQDGLNTCYANATSTILKSLLPDHPDVSYTHAAVMGTTRGWAEDWNKPNNKYLNKEDKSDNFTSFGWVCETVAGLKKAGGACPKNLSSIESTQLWDSDVQQRLFYGLGLYFDNMNLIKNDPAKMGQLKKDLSLAIEAINVEREVLIQQCEKRKQNRFPVFDAVKYLIEDSFYDNISEPSKCSNAKVEALKRLLAPESKIGNDRIKIFPSSETLASFNDMLESDELLAKDIDDFLLSSNPDPISTTHLISKLGNKLNSILIKLIPDEAVKTECANIPEGQSAVLKGQILEPSEAFLYQVKSSKENPCKDLLHPYALNDLLDPGKNPKSCLAPTNVAMILVAMKPLMEMETAINENLLPTLLNPESMYADQIVRAVMPGCLDQAKLISLKDVGCASFPFCDPAQGFNDSNTYTGPKDGCHSMDYAKKMVRTKSLNGINQGRALGVFVCTAFLTNPEIKTNFCSGGLPAGEKQGFHEMTITGYRCKADQIEYEIVNSWGNRCDENRNIECQKDANGDTTGPSWIKEESLVDSSINISTVSVKPK